MMSSDDSEPKSREDAGPDPVGLPWLENIATPFRLISEATKQVPFVRYALGVVGIAAGVAIIAMLFSDLRIAFFGVLIMFFFMLILFVLARMQSVAKGYLLYPFLALLWCSTVLAILTGTAFFTSVFFRWPVNLQHFLDGQSGISGLGDQREEQESEIKMETFLTKRHEASVASNSGDSEAENRFLEPYKRFKTLVRWDCVVTDIHEGSNPHQNFYDVAPINSPNVPDSDLKVRCFVNSENFPLRSIGTRMAAEGEIDASLKLTGRVTLRNCTTRALD